MGPAAVDVVIRGDGGGGGVGGGGGGGGVIRDDSHPPTNAHGERLQRRALRLDGAHLFSRLSCSHHISRA